MSDLHQSSNTNLDCADLADKIKCWAHELGFSGCGIADLELSAAEHNLQQWLARGFHGTMAYMARHGLKRSRPSLLVPGTLSVISVRMEYFPARSHDPVTVLNHPHLGYVSRYALGRDYHKVLRKRLDRLATRIREQIGPFGYRAFCDSAPVLEKPLAIKAGLGWNGKHTNLIDRNHGSWFFLGELYTDLPLPADTPVTAHCGHCQACLDICPTQAIIAPYKLDANRCISYLTIEHAGSIPVALRPLIGNRIYGCDDCQLICPWNRFANPVESRDFAVRNHLDAPRLIDLFAWSENEFKVRLEGSPIRRIGHERWLRNLAIALGNAPPSREINAALQSRLIHPSTLVQEHVRWALARQRNCL